jgi:hypothetical protein
MMQGIKKYLIAAGMILIAVLIFSTYLYQVRYQKERSERIRYSDNYRIVQDSVKLIQGENGLLARRLEAEKLTNDEIKKYYRNITAVVEDMKIELRKVTSVTAFNTQTTNTINTFFRDSLMINEVPVEKIDTVTKWFELHIRKIGKEAQISVASRDSLIQAVHWQRQGEFWPTRWMTKKEYFQDIKSMNPDSEITYSRWIIPYKYKR